MQPGPNMSTCHNKFNFDWGSSRIYILQSQSYNIHVEVCRNVAPVRYCVCFTTVECQPEPSLLNSLFSLSAKWGIVRPPMSKTSTQQHIFAGWGQAFTQCGHYWKVNYFVIQIQFYRKFTHGMTSIEFWHGKLHEIYIVNNWCRDKFSAQLILTAKKTSYCQTLL